MGFTTAYSAVSWTAGDVITEAKLDAMVANDQAYDSHSAQGLELDEMTKPSTPAANKIRLYAKDKGGVSTPYCLKDNGNEIELGNIDGWIIADETWEFVSVDDPTGVFRVNADVTTKYSAGMRIKFTNGGNVIYGIITVVGSFSGGYTSITFLHQIDPTDSLALVLMANSAITLNYYSNVKVPYGFPLSPISWTREFNSTTSTEAPLTQTTWTNKVGTLSVPIGLYKLSWSVSGCYGFKNGTAMYISVTLSTANNSESNTNLTAAFGANGATATLFAVNNSPYREDIVSLAAKTTYYLNFYTSEANVTCSNGSKTIIRALCAYL